MNFENEENKIQNDLNFADEEGNIYKTYLSLDEIYLNKPNGESLDSLTLYISKKTFKLSIYKDCFTENKDYIVLNLDKLLGLKDRLQSQVLTFVLKGDKESSSTRIVFLNRYILLKDPRREENNNHISVLLNSLVLDYLYKRDEKTSNLKVNLDGKKMYFLLEER